MSSYGRFATALVAGSAVAWLVGISAVHAQQGSYVSPVGPGSYAPPPEQFTPPRGGDWPPSSWEPVGDAPSRWQAPPGPYRATPPADAEQRRAARPQPQRPAWAAQPPSRPYPPQSSAPASVAEPGQGWAAPTPAQVPPTQWAPPPRQWQPPPQAGPGWASEPGRPTPPAHTPPQPGAYPPPGYGQGTPPAASEAEVPASTVTAEPPHESAAGAGWGAPPPGYGYDRGRPVPPPYGYGAPPPQYGGPWGWQGYAPPPNYPPQGYAPYGVAPSGQ